MTRKTFDVNEPTTALSHHPTIALLHFTAPPVIGGVEVTLAAHARLLVERGYVMKLIAGRGAGIPSLAANLHPLLDSRNPRVLQVQHELAAGQVTPAFDVLKGEILRVLDGLLAGIDVCIAHNVTTLHKNLALTAALHELAARPHLKIIAWCHDFAWHDPIYAEDLHPGFPWDLLQSRWPGVRYVVVSHARQADLARLLQMPAAEIAVVPPGVDAIGFLGLGATAAQWSAQFGLSEAAPLLLLPARVTRRKNIELAIDITAALRMEGLNPRLLVMGPLGPHNPANAAYLEELQARRRARGVQDAVILACEHGEVTDALRRDLYLLADALLMPSVREGFGIPLLEAGLARLPIFCADIAPFHESAGEWAHYFLPDDPPERIARGIAAALACDSRYQMKQRVAHEYAWPRIVEEKIEPLLREITP